MENNNKLEIYPKKYFFSNKEKYDYVVKKIFLKQVYFIDLFFRVSMITMLNINFSPKVFFH